MEHRYSERVDVDFKALIYKRGLPVAIGRVKNTSKHGLFVETDYADVNTLQKLELFIILKNQHKEPKRYHLKTLVIRKAMNGLGLELEALGQDDAQELHELVSTLKIPVITTQDTGLMAKAKR